MGQRAFIFLIIVHVNVSYGSKVATFLESTFGKSSSSRAPCARKKRAPGATHSLRPSLEFVDQFDETECNTMSCAPVALSAPTRAFAGRNAKVRNAAPSTAGRVTRSFVIRPRVS